jgi:hypothetical protein
MTDAIATVTPAHHRDGAMSEATIPMRIPCPECKMLHVDEGEWATRVHHTHSCQYCGLTWRPAVVATVGVRFLPGFKNDEPAGDDDAKQVALRWRRALETCANLLDLDVGVSLADQVPWALAKRLGKP